MAGRRRTKAEAEADRDRLAGEVLRCGSLPAAAKAADVPERTARRWIQEPGFRDRVGRVAANRLPEALEVLEERAERTEFPFLRPRFAEAVGTGLAVLLEVAQDKTASNQDRVAAARFLVSKGLDAQQGFEIDDKLDSIMAELGISD